MPTVEEWESALSVPREVTIESSPELLAEIQSKQTRHDAARQVIVAGGFGAQFTHRLGHGFGLEVHEPPFLVDGNETRLEPGMTFTVEPGIYQVGKFGVRIEDDCIMTETGIEVMSRRPAKF